MTLAEYRKLPEAEKNALYAEARRQGFPLMADFLAVADAGLIGQILLEDVHANEA